MANKYLDYSGLSHFWAKLKALFSKKSETITNITRNGTTFTATRADGTSFTFTQQDTGEENQNAFSNIKVGSTTISADTKTDTIEFVAGSNIMLTPDATNDKVTIDSTSTSFSNIKVGSTTIAADSEMDTFEFVAGNNITLTPDATNDKITIDSTASSEPSSTTPKMDGTAAVGTETAFARGDHIHPTDTSRAPLNSPGFTGIPTAPTATAETNDTQIATTEFVKGAVNTATADMLSEDWLLNSSIDGVKFDSSDYQDMVHYGECSDEADTLDKVVACNNFKLIKGSWIIVKFTNGNGYSSSGGPFTLNVNGTGAKTILYNGATGSLKPTHFYKNRYVPFIYDGENYNIVTTALDEGIKYISIPAYQNLTSSNRVTALSNTIGFGPGTGISFGIYSVNNVLRLGITLNGMTQSSATAGTSAIQSGISPKVLHDTIAGFGGVANGFAPLDSNSLIDPQYLPSYIDDVIEVYAVGATPLASDWLSLTAGGTPLTPESGKIYILIAASGDYEANSQFRWSGSTYVKLNNGGVSSITNSEIDVIVAS